MPSFLTRVARAIGFVPLAAAQRDSDHAAIAGAQRAAQAMAAQQRSLLAALTTPDVASWQDDGLHLNSEGSHSLALVRQRSRGVARNNEHGRRFVGMVLSNVLGPYGVRYQARLRTAAGAPRTVDNNRLEAGWTAAGERGVWDITGRYTRRQFDRIALRHVVVDGEVFVRERTGRGPHGVQFQLLTADAVPLGTNADLGGGRRIRQGVEFNANGEVLAYYVRTDDATLDGAAVLGMGGQRLVRVPAAEMEHILLPEEAGQLRGLPWMQAALKRMYQAADFAGAGLNKARESAKRGGFIQPDKEAVGPGGDQPQVVSGSEADTGPAYTSLQDGTWEKLLPGEVAMPFESEYPNIEYGQFIKDCVRGIASSLDCAYFSFGNDLEAVNYSSGQLGMEGERTMWMTVQQWFMDTASKPLHARWMRTALVAAPQLTGLQFDRMPQYLEAARWQAHRWQPIDKLKSTEADRSRVEAGFTSPQRVISDAGDDPDEIVAELQEWQRKTAGLLPAASATASTGTGTPAAGEEEAAARSALRLRLIANSADV